MNPAYRVDYGWRARPVFGAAGLRPSVAEHTAGEAAVIKRWATGRRMLVEIGVAEGGSAWDARTVMSPDGTLVLIDPYFTGKLGLSLQQITARRVVGTVGRGRVEWLRQLSGDAVIGWDRAIDFLLIDGDHSYTATRQDFEEWSAHVAPDGAIAFHDALVGSAPWMTADYGSAQFVAELRAAGGPWRLVDHCDSTAVFSRSADPVFSSPPPDLDPGRAAPPRTAAAGPAPPDPS